MKIAILLMATVFGLACESQKSSSTLVTLQSDNSEMLHSIVNSLELEGFDVAGINSRQRTFEVVVRDPRTLEMLDSREGAGFDVIDVRSIETISDDIDGYYDTDQAYAAIADLADLYPERAMVVDLNEWLQIPTTEGGQTLKALRVHAGAERPAPGVVDIADVPKVLIIGQHHARELMTHHAVIDSARHLLEAAVAKTAGDRLLARASYWFVPVVNPDGLSYVFSSDRMWRKNRARNDDGSRGVDLNRNYEFKWGECGNNSSNGSSQVYRGPAPHSEPEAAVMDALNAKLKAQFVISYHSSGDEVLYPYRCGTLAEREYYYDFRDRLAEHLNFGMRVASSSGEDFEHHYARYGSIAFLLELGTSFQPPYSTYEQTVRPSALRALDYVVSELDRSFLTFRVTADSEPLPDASINIAQIEFGEGEVRRTDLHGVYRWRLNPGRYDVTVKKAGYQEQTQRIDLGRNSQEIRLDMVPL